MNSVQPDSVQYGAHEIRFRKSQSISISIVVGDIPTGKMNIPQEAVLVEIIPPIIGNENQFVIGIGGHEYEAKADAFTRAKDLIKKNNGA